VGSIDDITLIIQSMDQMAGEVAGAVREQSAATQEISANVQSAATSTAEVSDQTETLRGMTGMTREAAKILIVSAHVMAGLANELDEKGREFREMVSVARQ
jgi:methyl-accepting chemotaxis protein